MRVLILTVSFVFLLCTLVASPTFSQDDPPLPGSSKKEDPPPPAKKRMVTKVQVTAEKAEIRSGDDLLAEVIKDTVLEYVKKNEEYFLVQMDGRKGWIKQSESKLIMVDESALRPAPPGTDDKRTSSDGSIVVSVKGGRITAQASKNNEAWTLPADGEKSLNILAAQFTPQGLRNLLIVVTDAQIMGIEPLTGKYLWTNTLRIENATEATVSFSDTSLVVKCGKVTCTIDTKTGREISRKTDDE